MKIPKHEYPKIEKTIMFDLGVHKHAPRLMELLKRAAFACGWLPDEFDQLSDFLIGKPFDEQILILEHYCRIPLLNEAGITQEDVAFLCHHHGHLGHYLEHKPIAFWDEYDWSNYRSLERKATRRIVRKYARFSKEVKEEDKYRVDSPPGVFFSSREAAQSGLSPETLSTINIYALWIEE